MSSTALVSPVQRWCWALLPRGTCGPGARVQPRCPQVLTGTNAAPAATAHAWPCISGHATQQAQCSFRSCRVENYSHKANLRPVCFALRVCVLGSNWCIKMYVNLKKWLQTDFLPHLRAPNAFFFPERFVPRSFELIFFIPFSLVCSECSGNGRKRESPFLGKSPHFSAAAIAKCLESQNSYFFKMSENVRDVEDFHLEH